MTWIVNGFIGAAFLYKKTRAPRSLCCERPLSEPPFYAARFRESLREKRCATFAVGIEGHTPLELATTSAAATVNIGRTECSQSSMGRACTCVISHASTSKSR
jgi:hypothetical protein